MPKWMLSLIKCVEIAYTFWMHVIATKEQATDVFMAAVAYLLSLTLLDISSLALKINLPFLVAINAHKKLHTVRISDLAQLDLPSPLPSSRVAREVLHGWTCRLRQAFVERLIPRVGEGPARPKDYWFHPIQVGQMTLTRSAPGPTVESWDLSHVCISVKSADWMDVLLRVGRAFPNLVSLDLESTRESLRPWEEEGNSEPAEQPPPPPLPGVVAEKTLNILTENFLGIERFILELPQDVHAALKGKSSSFSN